MLKRALRAYKIGGWRGLWAVAWNYICRRLGNFLNSGSDSRLLATGNALVRSDNTHQRKIVLVSHGAQPHGAQYLALAMAKSLVSDFGFQLDIVLLGEGILTQEFSRWGTVHILAGVSQQGRRAAALAQRLAGAGHQAAIVNSTASGLFLEKLAASGLHCVALVHELRGVIESSDLQLHAQAIAKHANLIVFPAQQVMDSFCAVYAVEKEKTRIRPQGLLKKNSLLDQNEHARKTLRQSLGLNENAKIILGMGYADHRKGIDLFVEAGLLVMQDYPEAYFVWVGHWEGAIQVVVKKRLASAPASSHFLFVGFNSDTDAYFAGADIFAMTSREDPFPSVVIQSLEVSVPVVGFRDAGGFSVLLEQGAGILVEKENIVQYANALTHLLNHPQECHALGEKGAALIRQSFSFQNYLSDILDWAGMLQPGQADPGLQRETRGNC